MSTELHKTILAEIVKHTGKRVSWRFIKQTQAFIPAIERFHNLITGIYKPAWSDYALSIAIMLNSPYEDKDKVFTLEDGRWLIRYSPRSGSLRIADNQSLIKCKEDQVPVAVFRQLSDRTDRQYGSTYQVLGLGLVTQYDAKADVFVVESANQVTIEQVTDIISDEEVRYEARLYAQLSNKFRPFVKEDTSTYEVSSPKRNRAFREIVLREYEFSCTVCEMKFHLGDLVEATAAHIIPKQKHGTDDPRNGLALCRTHHWAFDVGIFSISEDYRVLLSQIVSDADTRGFDLLELNDKSILLPQNDSVFPHLEAVAWHRKNVWLG